MQKIFILGTDTNCGKTYVSCALLEYLLKKNQKALAIKPVASGTNKFNINEDLAKLQLINKKGYKNDYDINNYLFDLPVSPHLAALKEKKNIILHDLISWCLNYPFSGDYLLIEGAGGLLVPLNKHETWLDFLHLSKIPIILVVGVTLGCLNHAFLTEMVLKQHEIECIGWIANCLDNDMLMVEENIATLANKLQFPLLSTIRFNGQIESILRI